MADDSAVYVVNLQFPDSWPHGASIELTPAEIPHRGELIGWTTEPVRDSMFAEPRPQYLTFRVAEVVWCLNPTTNTDREVYITLAAAEES